MSIPPAQAQKIALYRVRTNEVLRIVSARKDGTIQQFTELLANNPLLAIAIDPSTPNGDSTYDDRSPRGGPKRQQGFAKIYEPGSHTVRNATPAEIATLAPGEEADEAIHDAEDARRLMKTHPLFRKMSAGFLKLNNATRAMSGKPILSKAEFDDFVNANVTEND